MTASNTHQERSYTLITAVGKDRPGIVDDLSRWLFDRQMNIEDSRMALLGGEFAVLMLVSGGEGSRAELEARRDAFERATGLSLFVRSAEPQPAAPVRPALRYSLSATALDHPGIVARVTSLLRQHDINIVSATTRTTHAPFTGTPVFTLAIEMDVPAAVSLPRLREALQALGERENIDFDLSSAVG